ncbi:hypothetical protein, partial [Flavobacterium sp. CLA17]|uniref:hypothetical protein n=1 Tax=Flavobacterium sp. CLA17 TaxID=2724135 RepID=UPI0019676166
KRYAYSAVRNFIGAVIYMSSVVIFSVITCIFKLKIEFLNRPVLYVISGVFIYYYLLLAKKFLKPIFDNLELKEEKPPKDHFFVITLILAGLYGGGMYVLGRVLTIYLCG